MSLAPFKNFNFWSKVNTKVKVNQSKEKVNGYMVQVGSGISSRVTDWAAETLTSSYDVALTRIRVYVADDVACLCVADVDRMMSACHH